MVKRLLNWRIASAFIHDLFAACAAWVLAYLLRFNFSIPPEFILSLANVMLWAVPLQVALFVQFGLYKGVWRFASLPDLQRVLKAVLVASLIVVTLLFMFKPTNFVPRSVLVLDPLLLVLMIGGSRFIYRAWKDHTLYGYTQTRGEPVLLLGAGEAAIALVKDLARSAEWRVVGLLDDNRAMHGRQLHGAKVLGGLNRMAHYADSLGVKHAIVVMPSASHLDRKNAVELANEAGLSVLTVPAFDDLLSGKVNISQIRKVDVEDLLGRDAVKLDNTGLQHLIENHTVMVSGAGGSIGSELCRQIIKYKPNTLVCLDISEYALYKIEQEFNRQGLSINLVYMTGDVKNVYRMTELLRQYQPKVVFHAAAYKHVPLMENGNVWEAISNNVVGTYTLAKTCMDFNVEKFVLISTDKAVNPTNVMGASKRLGEMVCQGLQENELDKAESTRFVIVRFGNVLGSSGSVIPKFREQIADGGPITITHPDITRYFMSIPEASQLVMQAGLMGKGGEIFVLDMGEPVKIAALAADMIRLSGLQLDDIKIEYIGLRPGEKLYEELLADGELTINTPHEKLRIALAKQVDTIWVEKLLKWIDYSQGMNEELIKRELKFWVQEYNPQLQILTGSEVVSEQITLH
ncbi:MAG: nucleoside-diphosphate sugar epimerase/dehydratase [Pseudomonadota bacterium]